MTSDSSKENRPVKPIAALGHYEWLTNAEDAFSGNLLLIYKNGKVKKHHIHAITDNGVIADGENFSIDEINNSINMVVI